MGTVRADIRPGGATHAHSMEGARRCLRSGRRALREQRDRPRAGGDRRPAAASPFGEKFWFFANFQTAQNPFNAANTHLTSSDIAFWGDLAYVGDYGGFRIFDVSKPSRSRSPTPAATGRRVTRRCSTATTTARPTRSCCPSTACSPARTAVPGPGQGRRRVSGERVGGPARLRHLRPDGARSGRGRLPGLRLAHQHAAARARRQVDERAQLELPARRRPDVRPARRLEGPQGQSRRGAGHQRAVRDPADAIETTELPVVYPGDADGTYRPGSEHGLGAGVLDDFLGCHDLSAFPKKGIVGAACGEQAQVWNIDEETGLPDTAHPRWVYDQPNVDFWHSATFSWDGKVANFIDESFGDGCPTVTTKTGGFPAPSQFQTGNMYFFDTRQRQAALGVPQPAAVERPARAGGRRPADVLLLAPRHPGAVARPLPAGQRVLPWRLVGDRLHQPERPARDRVRRQGGHQHLVGLHVSARVGHVQGHPGVLQRRPQPQLRHGRRAELP